MSAPDAKVQLHHRSYEVGLRTPLEALAMILLDAGGHEPGNASRVAELAVNAGLGDLHDMIQHQYLLHCRIRDEA